jgi:hypothetical protein
MQLKMSSALTPTLSPGEREPPLGALDPITVQRLSYDGRNVLPLPGGEGWGEGGISLRLHGYGLGYGVKFQVELGERLNSDLDHSHGGNVLVLITDY